MSIFKTTHEKLGSIPFYLHEKVTHLPGGMTILHGKVVKVEECSNPTATRITVQFEDGRFRKFGNDGVALFGFAKSRTLFHGHKVSLVVNGEEAPKEDSIKIPDSMVNINFDDGSVEIRLPQPYAHELGNFIGYQYFNKLSESKKENEKQKTV